MPRLITCLLPTVRLRRRRLAAALLLAAIPGAAHAQLRRDAGTDWSLAAGGEADRYLRLLQLVGAAPASPWSIRPTSAAVAARSGPDTAGHPWAARLAASPADGRRVRVLAPEAGAIVNTGFPYGMNDGPVWAGRGLTLAATGGVAAAWGPLEVTIAPQLFVAQNAGFPLEPNGQDGTLAFADGRWPLEIDQPQRFGDGAYARLDPGQSSAVLRAAGMSVGLSTANEVWGPAIENPYLLSANAAGFAHFFLGTDGPLTFGPVRFGARLLAGRLDQSAWSPATHANRRRYLTGVVAEGSLAWLPNLEVGAARLFEDVWPDSGLGVGDILTPLIKNPFKLQRIKALGTESGNEVDNQLLSVFARWVFPASGFEVYGELGRDDNSFDLRDLVAEPDQSLTYTLGFQRAWSRGADGLLVLRGETMNSDISHLERVRFQAPPYIHAYILQGHTQRGQVIGAASGYGGGATSLAIDQVTRSGRRSLTWRRILREPQRFVSDGSFSTRLGPKDVIQALTAEWLMFRPRVDVAPEMTLAYNLNRYGEGGRDRLNLRAAVTARMHW